MCILAMLKSNRKNKSNHRWLRLYLIENIYPLPFLPLKAPRWHFIQLYTLHFLQGYQRKWYFDIQSCKIKMADSFVWTVPHEGLGRSCLPSLIFFGILGESVKLGKTPFWGFQSQNWWEMHVLHWIILSHLRSNLWKIVHKITFWLHFLEKNCKVHLFLQQCHIPHCFIIHYPT